MVVGRCPKSEKEGMWPCPWWGTAPAHLEMPVWASAGIQTPSLGLGLELGLGTHTHTSSQKEKGCDLVCGEALLLHTWAGLYEHLHIHIHRHLHLDLDLDLGHTHPQMRVCMLSLFSRIWLFATPWTIPCQASLSMGILQARILEWVAMPSSRGSFRPRDQTQVSYVSYTGSQILYHSCHLGSPSL